jgi:putative ATP-dependent endonuclease of OLD family
MIISELRLYNFRKFKCACDTPGLAVTFHKGLNALIGENDSGKTAIIDAIKLVLLTQSNEYIRPTDDDFYIGADGVPSTEFRIDCTLSDFAQNEAKNFIEYLTYEKAKDGIHYILYLHYRAWKEGNRIYSELKAGEMDDGVAIDGKARELLKAVYLKPLRDAEREMSAGRSSRISQILLSHPIFQNKNEHQLIDIFKTANDEIEQYFAEDEKGKVILQTIRNNLKSFNSLETSNEASLRTSEIRLKAIMESLSLNAAEVHPGLGELNLLFIAAELVLLKEENEGGIKLALIEELEAHLHPQAQLRLINFLQDEYNENGAQIIISTHSPILASKINLKNLILLKSSKGYDLSEGKTKLEKGDYLFLQRFLDTTKSNMFFAKGIIMVEGDAENILLPVIAEILGYPLEKHGVSVVNVGSTAFLRYSRIMLRQDGSTVGIPVAVITDCDIQPYDVVEQGDGSKQKVFSEKNEKSEQAVADKKAKYEMNEIHAFISPRWTLEYCIALSCLNAEFHKAIHYGKKISNSNAISLTGEKIADADSAVIEEDQEWVSLSTPEKAYRMYSTMIENDGKSSLKAIVAQCLASMLKWNISIIPDGVTKEKMFDLDQYCYRIDEEKRVQLKQRIESDDYLKYIVDAIKYATGVQ